MKIHIVQKGDTLWDIAKNYGVDFNELQQVNSHLSSPDMIMPGMKIRIPNSSKQVKQQTKHVKEQPKQVKKETKQVKEQQKPISHKPLAVKEDDHKKQKEVKQEAPILDQKEMPMMPVMPQVPPMMQMPKMEQQVQQYTTINMPSPKKETPKKPKEKPMKEKVKPEKPQMKPVEHMMQMPMHYQPMPMMPMCCYVIPNCCCHHHGHHKMMNHMSQGNCYGMAKKHIGPQIGNCFEQPATMPAQTQYEGHKPGFYNYSNMQHEQMNINNHGFHQQPMQTTQPYPPFYRSTPESPPNPTPPNYPPMSAHELSAEKPNND